MKKIYNTLSVLLMCFVLTGCWDQRQIEKRAYVYAIGMDKAEEENKFTITYLIINPEVGSQVTGGGSSEEPVEIISFETNDLISAQNLANAVIAKEISYDILGAIFVSEDFAKDDRFIRWIYDATKDRDIRRDNHFIVTKEKVKHFFDNNKPKLETRVNKYFDLILKRGTETGMIPESDLHRFFKITEADASLFISIYGTTEKKEEEIIDKEEDRIFAGQLDATGKTNPTQFMGAAVFKEGKMIGKLTAEETRMTILLNDTLEMSDVLTTFPDPLNEKYRIATRLIKKKNNDVKMKLKNHSGVIDVTIPLYVEVLSDHSMVNYGKDAEKRRKLKQFIEEKLASKLEEFVLKTQEEFQGEPFAWSLIGRKQFQTLAEYEKFNWMKSYPSMKVNIKVTVRFGEFGRQSKLTNYDKLRD